MGISFRRKGANSPSWAWTVQACRGRRFSKPPQVVLLAQVLHSPSSVVPAKLPERGTDENENLTVWAGVSAVPQVAFHACRSTHGWVSKVELLPSPPTPVVPTAGVGA